MPTNRAAYLTAPKTLALEIKEAPYDPPDSNEVVVKNAALGLNPVDSWLQAYELWLLQYPVVLGCDTAGTIVEVGANVSRFKIGDRVLGSAMGGVGVNKTGAFQEYTVLPTNMVGQIPDSLSFEAACTIPLALSTVACGLYQQDLLALPRPVVNPKPNGTTLLVWGAASSVGTQAVQLGIASGCEVIATASAKNFAYVQSLGARSVFDYHDERVAADIIAKFKGNKSAGAIVCAGSGQDVETCADIIAQSEGNKFVAYAMSDGPKAVPAGVEAKFILSTTIKDNEVADLVYRDYLPDALAQGTFVASPVPSIVGRGLGEIQQALNIRRDTEVSAKKLVVSL